MKKKKTKKKSEILAFKPLLQEIQLKILTSRKIFWSSNILSFEIKKKKIHTAEAYWNGAKLNYIPPYLW